jgi:hypothetical protein
MLNDIWGSINNPHDFFQQLILTLLILCVYVLTKPKLKKKERKYNV